MASAVELKQQFWSALSDSPFVMLGLAGVDAAHAQPMAAQFDDELPNRIWFYTNRQNRLVEGLTDSMRGVAHFSAKGHGLFASLHGRLSLDTDPAMVERFWSPVAAAWYEDGKDDANLAMLRLDLERGEIWQASTGNFLKYMTTALLSGSAEDTSQDDVKDVRF